LEPPSLGFSFSAAVPPAAPLFDPLELSLLEGSPLDSGLLASPLEGSEEEVAPEALLDVLDVVEVEVVWAAAFSAEVSVGGVMSGVLLGIASEVPLAPPHPPREKTRTSMTDAAKAARAIEVRRRSWEGAGRLVAFTRSVAPHRQALTWFWCAV